MSANGQVSEDNATRHDLRITLGHRHRTALPHRLPPPRRRSRNASESIDLAAVEHYEQAEVA